MHCSIVVRSLNEADRLRLMLTALTRQSWPFEVIVVDDGSADDTRAVVAEFASQLSLKSIHHDAPKGRAAATNAGIAIADGDLLLLMDGDVLLNPTAIEHHVLAHRARSGLLGRGEQYHLRCTRFLQNPADGTAMPGREEKIARLSPAELTKLMVTTTQVGDAFDQIVERANLGIYPGAGPAQLYALEIDALANHPDCPVLWSAAAGHNFSIEKAALVEAGGIDEALDHNDHREMALRMVKTGGVMGFVPGAASYHLTHRSGWRDPLADTHWESVFYRRHPELAVKLLSVFWAGMAQHSPVPAAARIVSLPDLAEAAAGGRGVDYDAVRRMIPGLQDLSAVC